MKKIMLSIFILSIIMVPFVFGQTTYDQFFTNADDVTFLWEYSFPSDNSTLGFNLFFQNVSGGTINKVPVLNKALTVTVNAYPIGSYLNWITVYDKYGNYAESVKIQVNKKQIKPGVPITITIRNPAFTIIIPH